MTGHCYRSILDGKGVTNGIAMAKAQIRTADGLTVKVEGTPKEIAEVVKDLKKAEKGAAGARRSHPERVG